MKRINDIVILSWLGWKCRSFGGLDDLATALLVRNGDGLKGDYYIIHDEGFDEIRDEGEGVICDERHDVTRDERHDVIHHEGHDVIREEGHGVISEE